MWILENQLTSWIHRNLTPQHLINHAHLLTTMQTGWPTLSSTGFVRWGQRKYIHPKVACTIQKTLICLDLLVGTNRNTEEQSTEHRHKVWTQHQHKQQQQYSMNNIHWTTHKWSRTGWGRFIYPGNQVTGVRPITQKHRWVWSHWWAHTAQTV